MRRDLVSNFIFFFFFDLINEVTRIRTRLTRRREALEPGCCERCWAGREATTTSVRPTGRRRRRPHPALRTVPHTARTTACCPCLYFHLIIKKLFIGPNVQIITVGFHWLENCLSVLWLTVGLSQCTNNCSCISFVRVNWTLNNEFYHADDDLLMTVNQSVAHDKTMWFNLCVVTSS